MTPVPIMIITAVFLLGFLGLYFFVNKREKGTIDYYNLFMMGVIWAGVGLPLQNYALSVVGLILMGIGGFNKDKWKTSRLKKRRVLADSIIWGLVLLVGLVLSSFICARTRT